MMARGTKRRSGRKPQGEFDELTSPFSVRMPDYLRSQLEAAAKKTRRSVGQELLRRLDNSFSRDRDKERDDALRALTMLISKVALRVKVGAYQREKWHRDPFAFEAFRLAVGRVLERLQPSGAIRRPVFQGQLSPFETPESLADSVADEVLYELFTAERLTREVKKDLVDWARRVGDDRLVEHMPRYEWERHAMADAREHLQLTPKKGG
jgi:hypothetical protein